MKIAIYPDLLSIPEPDRADYKLETAAGSPNFNKFVLDLDPQHPVAVKNTQLLAEKQTSAATHATELQGKDTAIQTLTAELETAKRTTGVPAGQVAVPVDEFQTLQQYKALGDLPTVQTKINEHSTLKAEVETQNIRTRLEEVAERNGMDKAAFVQLAMGEKLADLLETTEIANDKGEKVKHDLVKTKDSAGADTKVGISDFVKTNDTFKPFLNSLFLSAEQKKKIKIPENNTGDTPAAKSGASAYINRHYKPPVDKKTE